MVDTGASRRRFLQHALAAAASLATGPVALAQHTAGPAVADNPMGAGRPSATAEGAAMLRAAHQLLDHPKVLDDPYALRIIHPDNVSQLLNDLDRYRLRRSLRASVALRSRYAEDELARAVGNGVRQYVILGAGLDTFACRNPHERAGLRIFEVDHPATQSWKRARLRESGLAMPPSLTFAPVDFERETLGDALARAGLRRDAPAFFSLLGVVIYLTKPAVMETLRWVASLPAGSEIVFSYSVPSSSLTEPQRAAREKAAQAVAAIGEPWITYFDPAALAQDLTTLGFTTVRDLGPAEANARYFSHRDDGLRVSDSGRLMKARV